MIRLYVEDNKTQKEIAEIFCTYNTTIRRILQRNNIEIRGNSEIQSFIKLEDIKDKEGTNSFDYFIGLLASDGCVTNNNIVLDFADQICEFLKSNNITAYIQETKTQEGRNNYYNVCVYKQGDIKLIFKLMYLDASLFLKRKYEKFGSL